MTGNIDELSKKIEKTRDARFNASRRLANHHRISVWLISLVSAILIVLPQIKFQDSKSTLWDIGQSVIALVLLVYSLILPAENYQHRALKMHECGLKLGALITKIRYQNLPINQASIDYQNILDDFDNHEEIDYLPIKVREQIKELSRQPNGFWKFMFLLWKYIVYYFITPLRITFGYSYYIPMLLIFIWLGIRFVLPIFSE